MGDFTYIRHNSRLSRTKIGKFCSIAPNVLCGVGKRPTRNFVSTSPVFFSTRN